MLDRLPAAFPSSPVTAFGLFTHIARVVESHLGKSLFFNMDNANRPKIHSCESLHDQNPCQDAHEVNSNLQQRVCSEQLSNTAVQQHFKIAFTAIALSWEHSRKPTSSMITMRTGLFS